MLFLQSKETVDMSLANAFRIELQSPQAVLGTTAAFAELLAPATSQVCCRKRLAAGVAGAVSGLLRLRFSSTELFELLLRSLELGGHCWQEVLRPGVKSYRLGAVAAAEARAKSRWKVCSSV